MKPVVSIMPALLVALFTLCQSTSVRAQNDLASLTKDDKQWVMAPKNYASTRYSGLDQINTKNVGELKLAWTFSLGSPHGQEAAPLIVNGTMYVVGPYPNDVFALDAVT